MSEENQLRPHIVIKDEPAPPVKREYPPGGSTYKRDDYGAHAKSVSTEAKNLKAIFAKSKDSSSTNKVFFRLELPEDQKVETSNGKQVSDKMRVEIIGSPKENVAHVSANKDSFDDLTTQLSEYSSSSDNKGKSKFSAIEHIDPIPFEEKVTERFLDNFEKDDEEGEALIELFEDVSTKEAENISIEIANFLKQSGGEVLDTDNSNTGKVIRVKSKKNILKQLSEMFLSVQSLDSVDQVIEYQAIEGERLEDTVKVLSNDSNALACVIDTGVVKNSRFLEGSLIDQEFPFGDSKGVGVDHGTFVASRVIYGDDIKGQMARGVFEPDVKVLSVCTKEFDAIGNPVVVTIDRLIKVIRDVVVRWHEQIKVYNLSIGCIPTKPGVLPGIKDDVVHPLAAELDFLSRKYDVLFVISAGNYPHDNIYPAKAYPSYFDEEVTRILSPSESMLGITVGSTARETISGSMADLNEPSPFTRKGPGFNNFRKPDIATHGGNLGNNFSPVNFLMSVGINKTGNAIAYGNGTSFAAPIITRLAAKLFESVSNATAPLVKAMLLHFSEVIESSNFTEETLKNLVGNGIPIPEKITNSHKHSQTFLYQGEMDYRDMIEVPFYVPKGLVSRKGNQVVRVRATIVFAPETSKVLRTGYCKSHIRTKIIKLDKNGVEKGESFSKSKEFDSGRYSTVIKMSQKFSNQVTGGEWKILVAHESRWTLKNPKTKFAVVVTVEDPKLDESIDIYNLIRSEVSNKYKAEVNIREKIRI